MKKKCRSSIGGQAVLEGVMMRGERSMATAVRDENGNIVVESKRIKPIKEKSIVYRIPFIRGVLNFVDSMFSGVGIIMRSASVFDAETEPGKTEQWMAKKMKVNVFHLAMVIAVILGLALSIGLFFVLPQVIVTAIANAIGEGVVAPLWLNLIEGGVRLTIFIGYLLLVLLMKEIRRVFQYHGAEHKVISCYEHGLDMTVENAKTMSTVHDRCGTTFMVIVMVLSILLFSITGWSSNPNLSSVANFFVRLGIRLALLPAVAGISYEILKFLAKFDNWFVKAIKAPGLLFQKLTTKQPSDDMLEVALLAFNTVLAMDNDETIPEQSFDVKMLYNKAVSELNTVLEGDDFSADRDWIMCEVLGVKRAELALQTHIKESQLKKALEFARRRATGEPLQQVLGYTEFYGYRFEVNSDVLCPRPETEILVEAVSKNIGDKTLSVLDLCTGSGAIAVSLQKLCKNSIITASDISEKALAVAKRNAEINDCNDIAFKESDMFQSVEGSFDIIVTNPPYINTDEIATLQKEVKDYEPIIALDGGKDGLDFYRKIADNSHKYLNNGGKLYLECGINQSESIKDLLNKNFENIIIIKDLDGIDRIVVADKK